MMDQCWCLFFFPLRERTLHPWVLLFEPLGKQSQGTPLAVVELCLHSPWPPWLPWSSRCCSCHGNCNKALHCHSLAWKLFSFWSPAVPTKLSAVCRPLILTTTVVLMYDEGKVGVNCQLQAERGSSLSQLMDKSKQCYVLNPEYYIWVETSSKNSLIVLCWLWIKYVFDLDVLLQELCLIQLSFPQRVRHKPEGWGFGNGLFNKLRRTKKFFREYSSVSSVKL